MVLLPERCGRLRKYTTSLALLVLAIALFARLQIWVRILLCIGFLASHLLNAWLFAGRMLRWLQEKNESFSSSLGLVVGATLGVIALTVHSFFDFNLQIPGNTLFVANACWSKEDWRWLSWATLRARIHFSTERSSGAQTWDRSMPFMALGCNSREEPRMRRQRTSVQTSWPPTKLQREGWIRHWMLQR